MANIESQWSAADIDEEMGRLRSFVRDTVERGAGLMPMVLVFANVNPDTKEPERKVWVLHLEDFYVGKVEDGTPIPPEVHGQLIREARRASHETAATAVVSAMIGIGFPAACLEDPDWDAYRRGTKRHPDQTELAQIVLEQRGSTRAWVAHALCDESGKRYIDEWHETKAHRLPSRSGEIFSMFADAN
jgi:hypothetical protein